LGLPTEGFVVLFLGRKSDYKGLDLALDAHAALRSLHPEMRLLAVGPETDYSKDLWLRHQDLNGLHILGAVSHEDKVAALQASDCLVLPSGGESFGIVFLEAWIMNKPVIGARTLSVASLIQDGYDGLLSKPGDVADLAACIARLSNDPELAHRLGARGREKVLNHYTVPRIAERVEGIYLRVLRHRWREEQSAQ
jgi:glycosyltransferase involved in cell wall biosynthesis